VDFQSFPHRSNSKYVQFLIIVDSDNFEQTNAANFAEFT
jgi:hypothetical protein